MRTARDVLARIDMVMRDAPPLLARIQTAISRLSLLSQVSAPAPPLPPPDVKGPAPGWRTRRSQPVVQRAARQRPAPESRAPANTFTERPRTPEERADLRAHYLSVTPELLRRRVANARTVADLEEIARDAESAVRAWRVTPIPADHPLLLRKTDPMWKRYVAMSSEPANVLAARYGVSARHIRRIRSDYAA